MITRKIYALVLFSLILPTINFAACDSDCQKSDCDAISQNLWMPRPFSSYKTREMILLQDHKSLENVLSFATEYMQNFGCHSDRLGSLPFWSGTNTMIIGTNDGKSDLDAYQFGLGEVETPGSITMNPQVQHVGAEMLWRVLHSPDKHGCYFQVKVPLGAMMIDPNVTEVAPKYKPLSITTAGGVEDAPNLEDPDWSFYPVTCNRYTTLTEALTASFDHREPDMQFARLYPGKATVIRCGDIEAVAGYNVYVSEQGYVGGGFKVTCPTGNVPDSQFMLEPIFGRAGHWGIGAELHGNYMTYECDDLTVSLSMRGDVLHLRPGRKPDWRTFDLALNGVGSKYLLVQRYIGQLDPNNPELIVRAGSEIEPAGNITTMPVRSKISVEGSVALACHVQKENWNASLISEFWGRSQECLSIDINQRLAGGRAGAVEERTKSLNEYAVLGRQINEKDLKGADDINPTAVLDYCEPKATIKQSVARQVTTTNTDPDNVKDAKLDANRIPEDPYVALDITGAQAPRALTGKVTVEAGYTWTTSELAPHVSLFGGVEFANQRSKFENLWSVGLQGSMVF
ncbi:MAG: hypothetical protein CL947_00330 [Epsilonproteobacteria bacterium]|nr:hypothetical protein [Campylobacterota bacterium]